MKGMILITNNFEDVEAIATVDVLRRAGLEVDYVSIDDDLEKHTQSYLPIKCDRIISNINLNSYDFLIIPGGKAVMSDLRDREDVENIIHDFAKRDKLVATICAAPYLVLKLGYLDGGKFTCYPGCDLGLTGAKKVNKGVVRYKNFITGKAMAYSIDFALEIVDYLLGKKEKEVVESSIHGIIK